MTVVDFQTKTNNAGDGFREVVTLNGRVVASMAVQKSSKKNHRMQIDPEKSTSQWQTAQEYRQNATTWMSLINRAAECCTRSWGSALFVPKDAKVENSCSDNRLSHDEQEKYKWYTFEENAVQQGLGTSYSVKN